MEIDRRALDDMMAGRQTRPLLRFFRWNEPVVTYGYLLDPALVSRWAAEYGNVAMVQRPTGGGAVAHDTSDLSLSLLWPRKSGILPDNPADCYAAIHAALSDGVRDYLGGGAPALHVKDKSCETRPTERFSACFSEPVCDDVMLDGRKIIGGALRLTRQAVLYQGAVQLRGVVDIDKLRDRLLTAMKKTLLQTVEA